MVKATLDLLIIFVDYSEGESGHATPNNPGGSGSPSGSGEDPHLACAVPFQLPLPPSLTGSYSPNGLPSTALLFKDAVEIISEDHGIKPWSYLMEIIAENSIADPDVQSKAVSLINKVLYRTTGCGPP